MAYLSKKNVNWTLEPVSLLSSVATEYSEVQKTLNKSTHSRSLVSSCPSVTVVTTSPSECNVLPSLAPLNNQEVEVSVLTNIPQHTSVDMNGMYGQREQDRKVRREIANSNERRRMQSINAGFKSLKAILPQTAGEKLSKAAILQQTAEYILQLDSDKTKLLTLNERYRSALADCKCDNSKRRALLNEGLDKDEGIGSPREEELEDFHRDSVEVRIKLDKERKLRIEYEEKIRELEAKIRLHQESSFMLDSRSHLVIKPKSSPAEMPLYPRVYSSKIKAECPAATHSDKHSLAMAPTFPHQAVVSSSDVTPRSTSPPACAQPSGVGSYPVQDPTKPTGVHRKLTTTLPRSRQPLKKRAVEIVDADSPKNKISKFQVNATSANPITNASSPKPVVVSPAAAPKSAVLVQHGGTPSMFTVTDPAAQGNSSVTVQPATGGARLHQDKLLQTSGILNIRPTMTEPVLISGSSSAPPTYITLSPASVTWPDSQVALTAPNYSFAITPNNHHAQSQYVIQPPPLARVHGHQEEITLNQLNTVPSLSMTLTQLNAVPTIARLNSGVDPNGAVLPNARLQTHYLPVVAMDTVLGHQSERRMSSATTDSAPSDEESKSADDRSLHRITHNSASASSRRTKSDPGVSLRELHSKEIVLCNPNGSVLAPTNLSALPNGPGSPLYRQIDAAATRRNLETIVQAIDHLEQQERRNSQDQQTNP